jgi:hypothetical protein
LRQLINWVRHSIATIKENKVWDVVKCASAVAFGMIGEEQCNWWNFFYHFAGYIINCDRHSFFWFGMSNPF